MADLSRDAKLAPDEPLLQSTSKLFFYLWNQAWNHASGTASGDADALHDMRVNLRRLRSALQNFEGAADAPLINNRVRREFSIERKTLGKLGDFLGTVRDHDVLDDYLKSYAKDRLKIPVADSPGLAHFERYLQTERAQSFAPMVKKLNRAQEPGKAREQFARWALGLPGIAAPPLSLIEASRIILPQRLDDVRALSHALADGADGEGHHEFRKSLRRLRYALETLGVCFEGSLKAPLKTLVEIQDILGEMQDREVLALKAREAFGDSSSDSSAELPPDIVAFLNSGEMRRRRLLGTARTWWTNHEHGVLDEISALMA